jgi:hypothetical protein
MTVTIYIWYPFEVLDQKSSTLSAIFLKEVGHVSMKVKDTYISHRPSPEQNNDSIHFLEYLAQFVFLELSVEKHRKNRNENSNDNERRNDAKDNTKKYIKIRPVKRADSTNYVDECNEKKRSADKVVLIEGLNEEKILEYYSKQKDSTYHPFSNNCCTYIANILRESLNCTPQLCNFCSLRYLSYPGSLFITDSRILKKRIKIFLSLVKKRLKSLAFTSIGLLPLMPSLLIFNIPVLMLANILLSLNIPVWTPKIIEEFIGLIDDNSEKICLKNQITL